MGLGTSRFSSAAAQAARDVIFNDARTQNGFLERPVDLQLIRDAYELCRMGPTSMNTQPMRMILLTTVEKKAALIPALKPGNVEKTRMAPVTAILSTDTRFYEWMPRLFPHADVAPLFEANVELAWDTALRNATLQCAYFMMALRFVGLDSGAMSGFDSEMVNEQFHPDGRCRVNFLLNIGSHILQVSR